MIIVKTNDSVIFHNIDNRPYYDEPVLLSCGSFILINSSILANIRSSDMRTKVKKR